MKQNKRKETATKSPDKKKLKIDFKNAFDDEEIPTAQSTPWQNIHDGLEGSYIGLLPSEILLHIFSHMTSVVSLVRFSRTCKNLYKVTSPFSSVVGVPSKFNVWSHLEEISFQDASKVITPTDIISILRSTNGSVKILKVGFTGKYDTYRKPIKDELEFPGSIPGSKYQRYAFFYDLILCCPQLKQLYLYGISVDLAVVAFLLKSYASNSEALELSYCKVESSCATSFVSHLKTIKLHKCTFAKSTAYYFTQYFKGAECVKLWDDPQSSYFCRGSIYLTHAEYENLREVDACSDQRKFVDEDVFQNVTKLSLRRTKHFEKFDLKDADMLRELDLFGWKGSGLTCPAHLTKLVISNCTRIGFNDIRTILNYCTKLETLEMRRLPCVSDRTFAVPLNRGILANLKSLDIWGCNVYDKGINAISHLTQKLKELNISDTKISDVSLILIASKQPGLRSLSMRRCNVSDRGLERIVELPLLEKLDVSGISLVTDKTILAISEKCKNMKSLHFENNFIQSEKSIASLAKCKYLEELIVKLKVLNDWCVSQLLALEWIESLDVSHSSITQSSFWMMAKKGSLKHVTAYDCQNAFIPGSLYRKFPFINWHGTIHTDIATMRQIVNRRESTKFLIDATLMEIKEDQLFEKTCPCGGAVQQPLDTRYAVAGHYCTKCYKYTKELAIQYHCGKFWLQDWTGQVFAFAYKDICKSILTEKSVQQNLFKRGRWLIDVGEYTNSPAYYIHAYTPHDFQKNSQQLLLELQHVSPSKTSVLYSEIDIHLDLKQLHKNISDCLNQTTDSLVPRDPPASPSVWVTKYLDSSQKFGLAFGLVDGTVGVHFRDGTKMISRDKIEFIEPAVKDNGKKIWKRQVVGKNAEASVEKKKNLLGYFKTALYKKEGPQRPFSVNIADMESSVVFVHKWFKTKSCLIFVLSNNTVQVRFPDHSSVLFSGEGLIVSFIQTSLESSTCYLPSAMLDQDKRDKIKEANELLGYWLFTWHGKSGCDEVVTK